VSCGSPGNCSAGGFYTDKSGFKGAFVVGETNGTWGTAMKVAAALNTGGDAAINSVSCASAGNCTAGGSYTSSSGGRTRVLAFVISETNGTWGTVQQVASAFKVSLINSVSCGAAGTSPAAGYAPPQAFAVNEKNGTWGTAQKVAVALNTGHFALINSVSCASPGNCSAGGYYTDSSSNAQAFGVSERNGAWG